MKKDIYFDSCGAGKIRGCIWEPEGQIKGVIQIVHGIAEHMDRYDHMAAFFNQHGFLVVGEDHMGHGLSVQEEADKGCFYGSWHNVVKDTYQLLQIVHKEHPDVPYYIFGHSMGSFITRTLLYTYPDAPISGCILSGTAWMPGIVLGAGKAIAGLICKLKGDKHRSTLLQGLMFGSYNSKIKEPRTEYDWLSCDPTVADSYIADPMCGFVTSAGLLRQMLTGMIYNQNRKNLVKMNKSLPVHFLAGDQDPVGDYGKGVQTAFEKFKAAGLENVSCRLYAGCRHEVHNEAIAEEMFRDVLNFISE